MSRQVGAHAKRRQYNADVVNHAADLVSSGAISLSKAAQSFCIPKTTLHDRVHKKYASVNIGARPVLNDEEETRVVSWALHMSKIGYGRTRAELCDVIKRIIEADGRPNTFVDNRPGRKWLKRFFERHPELTLRTTVQLGKERAVISRDKISRWFDDFFSYVNQELKDPDLLKDASRIYNADESGFSLCPTKGGKVIGSKGAPVVYHYGNSDKTQMTIMAAASASGHFIQPMIIFPGQRFGYNPLEGFEEAALGRSENGWMDSEVFIGWLKNVFIPEVEARKVKKPVLLLIDGHKTHVSMEASDTCIANGIELYCLLEHSSHVLQPLDLRFFGQLKMAWRHSVRDWQLANVGEFVTKKTFARVFKSAWLKASTVDAAVKGFLEAGLFPQDPSKVMASMKLEPSKIFHQSPVTCCDRVQLTPSTTQMPADSQEENDDHVNEKSLNRLHTVPSADPIEINEASTCNTSMDVDTQVITGSVSEHSAYTSPVKAVGMAEPCTSGGASPFSKYLSMPQTTQSCKPKAKKVAMPKAITGFRYRQMLQEKMDNKARELEEKEKRKQERIEKRQKKQEEIKLKKLALEKKRIDREKFRQQQKERKERKRAREEQMLKELDLSDSDDGMSVEPSKCFKCEQVYQDFIECTNCYRRFHLKCVEDDLISGIDELPFECKYC